jgi:hypothetical protein
VYVEHGVLLCCTVRSKLEVWKQPDIRVSLHTEALHSYIGLPHLHHIAVNGCRVQFSKPSIRHGIELLRPAPLRSEEGGKHPKTVVEIRCERINVRNLAIVTLVALRFYFFGISSHFKPTRMPPFFWLVRAACSIFAYFTELY